MRKKREDLGHYLAFNGTVAEPNTFGNPDDYLSFIEAYTVELAADAWKGYLNHGRGIVVLQGPYGTIAPFVKACYVTCEPEDFEAFGRAALAREDCEEYDPGREIVVGVTDPAESFLQFWRITPGEMTPPAAFAAVEERRRQKLALAAPQRGEPRTPPTMRTFWNRRVGLEI